MHQAVPPELQTDLDPAETQDWLEALSAVLRRDGPVRVRQLLTSLLDQAELQSVPAPYRPTTPYVNTIPREEQPPFPGDHAIEWRIRSAVRWNAMAMVARANRDVDYGPVGGHISTFASSALLYEIGFNHFFHARTDDHPGDMVYFQGHASPGMYARAFLEGRLSEHQLVNFRRELQPDGGLPSYPHPWLMPDFWQFPTVSMGLGPLCAIYHARFLRYMTNRGIKDLSKSRVWCFIGDGECDEPETLGALSIAAREQLDNLTFVVNCNLQRLDGPVRGNGKIIQELEGIFRGAGWNAIKVIWGSDWDPLLARDHSGALRRRMAEVVDGQYQKYATSGGAYIREHFFGTTPELRELVEHLSDEQLSKLRRGGHDPEKVYAAYRAAVAHEGQPTVILCKTIKGYGLGESGEARNIAHNAKKRSAEEMLEFRSRFNIPLSDDEAVAGKFFKFPEGSPEHRYLLARRQALGGPLPRRSGEFPRLQAPELGALLKPFEKSAKGSTTMALLRVIQGLLREKPLGKHLVPIIPDESRTFGFETLFGSVGIYSPHGQLYEPVDKVGDSIMYYKEARNGQVLQEGINEAGAMGSFMAAGTAYANVGVPMIPFFIYYSMFGFQRVGDLIWAAADSRTKGFLLGATAGRTTLNGEGLQHEDGHSHLLASTVPNCCAYDPAWGYELAVIIQDGLRRMYQDDDQVFYYVTLYNDDYEMPAAPQNHAVFEGIRRGMYRFSSRDVENSPGRPQLFGSGPILRHVVAAQQRLAEHFGIASDVWSVTSYKELRRDGLECERWNLLHPDQPPRTCYVQQQLEGIAGPFVASSDYMRLVSEQIAPWIPGRYIVLGTDGFGRSESREDLRRHFEIDAEHVAYAAIVGLFRDGKVDAHFVKRAADTLGIDPDKRNPLTA